MAENNVEKELTEIKNLLQKAQRRADIQWVYNIGFAGVIASLALVSIKADTWAIIVVFVLGLGLMIAAPYIKK